MLLSVVCVFTSVIYTRPSLVLGSVYLSLPSNHPFVRLHVTQQPNSTLRQLASRCLPNIRHPIVCTTNENASVPTTNLSCNRSHYLFLSNTTLDSLFPSSTRCDNRIWIHQLPPLSDRPFFYFFFQSEASLLAAVNTVLPSPAAFHSLASQYLICLNYLHLSLSLILKADNKLI